MFRGSLAVIALGVALLGTSAVSRADDACDPFELLKQSYKEQTSEDLPGEVSRNVLRAWLAFEAKNLAKTTDDPPRGALVLYHTPYGGTKGRIGVSAGRGNVYLGTTLKESLPIDTVPGRLGWVLGPTKRDDRGRCPTDGSDKPGTKPTDKPGDKP